MFFFLKDKGVDFVDCGQRVHEKDLPSYVGICFIESHKKLNCPLIMLKLQDVRRFRLLQHIQFSIVLHSVGKWQWLPLSLDTWAPPSSSWLQRGPAVGTLLSWPSPSVPSWIMSPLLTSLLRAETPGFVLLLASLWFPSSEKSSYVCRLNFIRLCNLFSPDKCSMKCLIDLFSVGLGLSRFRQSLLTNFQEPIVWGK